MDTASRLLDFQAHREWFSSGIIILGCLKPLNFGHLLKHQYETNTLWEPTKIFLAILDSKLFGLLAEAHFATASSLDFWVGWKSLPLLEHFRIEFSTFVLSLHQVTVGKYGENRAPHFIFSTARPCCGSLQTLSCHGSHKCQLEVGLQVFLTSLWTYTYV